MNSHSSSERFIREAREYVEDQLSNPPDPNTAMEYFSLLLAKGLATREDGNYGIAAVFLNRIAGVEMRFFGVNELMTK
jgi:hypothetical protein